MSKTQNFTAEIIAADKGGAYLECPFEVEKIFGEKRPKVKVIFEGKVDYRGSLVRMKTDCHILIIRKDIRKELGKNIGDKVSVQVEPDTEPREVEIPALLAQALNKEKEAAIFFNGLSYTHQKEYVGYITEAKREATRERRTKKVVGMLKQQNKTIR